jgi:ribonuclease P protein component
LSFDRRLHYSWEYRQFFNQSQVFRLSECTVFRIQNNLGHFRLGITLKARGTSVNRNRVKRQIREAIRLQAKSLGSFDYNVVISGSKRLDYIYALRLRECLTRQLPYALADR